MFFKLLDAYIDELVSQHRHNAIFKWGDIPFRVRKDIARSIKYHNGNIAWGAYGEMTWTFGENDSHPCDVAVSTYFRQLCPETSYVVIVGNNDHNDLIEFIKMAMENDRQYTEENQNEHQT